MQRCLEWQNCFSALVVRLFFVWSLEEFLLIHGHSLESRPHPLIAFDKQTNHGRPPRRTMIIKQ